MYVVAVPFGCLSITTVFSNSMELLLHHVLAPLSVIPVHVPVLTAVEAHSEHRFPAPSSKLCQI